MLYFILIVVVLVVLCYAIDIFRNRHPLTADEASLLSQKRRRNRALLEYRFCSNQRVADRAEKKAMDSTGQFVVCDFDFLQAPSRIAGLLKYKKHEWVVLAFISSSRVSRLWWNKGPDGTQVWAFLREHDLDRAIQ